MSFPVSAESMTHGAVYLSSPGTPEIVIGKCVHDDKYSAKVRQNVIGNFF